MGIRVLAVGKKHESWITEGVARYEKRLRKPWQLSWQFVPHASGSETFVRQSESAALLAKLNPQECTILLDERGKLYDSVQFSMLLARELAMRNVTLVIGGAYGVDAQLQQRADYVWSLSPLVFPHQLVRLVLAEQVYRAAQIQAGTAYHHV